ncbi:ATP-binding cassette domain-containing protein [Lyngbya aestuarii]|uniref:ATP-binding cassette domain-containing protein n=1 Tax=Lyngbya aestuarii TaxID=118322 RepID=UPI00403D8B18
MVKYLSKVLFVLGERKKLLPFILALFMFSSVMEAVGVGMIGPYIAIASKPEIIQQHSLLVWVYKQLNPATDQQFLLLLGIAIVLVFIFKSLLAFSVKSYIFKFTFNQKRILVNRLMKSYLSAPYTLYLKQNTANIIKNITGETNRFTGGCLQPLLTFTANLVVVVVLLLLLAKTSPLLLVMVLGILLPTFLLFQRLGKKFRKWGKITSETSREMIRVINHGLGGLKETRVIGCESYFENQMDIESEKFARVATKYASSQVIPNILIQTCLIAFLILFVSLSQILFQQSMDDLTAVMSVFAVASLRLIPTSSQLINAMNSMRNSGYALDTLYLELKEIGKQGLDKHLDDESSSKKGNLIASKNTESQVMTFKSQVDLINVAYSYPGTSEPAIKDISLSIKKGQSIALIGKSGAGKTTLVDVILGLLEIGSGDIRVDDVSVYDNIRSWQNLIGYIPQSIFLIDDTVERNIAFGVPDNQIDSGRLNRAIKAAQLEELVAELPDGVKTSVGERGVRLSGGQRQRIGIARALYHEREILVLDEATSALDNETEHLISESINSLAGTKTLIIIAHRLSTVENCDRIYMLEKGGVVKSGTFQEVVLEGSKSNNNIV